MSSQNQNMPSGQNQNMAPVVSGSAVISAGLASAAAATVTSRFGVAGTLLGAAVTTMIITGGSALLKAYMESAAGKIKSAPANLRARTLRNGERVKVSGRPGILQRLSGAFSWFAHLPGRARRPILIKSAIGMAVAFIIGLGVITAAEAGIGNSLSCSLWGKCGAETAGAQAQGSDGGGGTTLSRLVGGGGSSQQTDQNQQVTPDQGTPQQPSQQPQQDNGGGFFDGGSPGGGQPPTPQEPAPTPQEPAPTPQEPAPTPQEPAPTPQEQPAPSGQGSVSPEGASQPSELARGE